MGESGRKVRIGAYWQVPERLFDDPDEMLGLEQACYRLLRRAYDFRSEAA